MVALDQRQVADFPLPGPGRHPAAFAAALATRPAKAARARGPPTLLLRPHDTGLCTHDTGLCPHDTGLCPHDTGLCPHDTGLAAASPGPHQDPSERYQKNGIESWFPLTLQLRGAIATACSPGPACSGRL